MLSSSIGLFSFLVFSYCRMRWPLLFAPRTKLKGKTPQNPRVSANQLPPGFSPHEAHAHQAFFGWILPTIRTSEFTILQIVGLDAAVVSGIPTPLHAKAHYGVITSVVKLLQDVVLPVLCLFHIRGGNPYANQLEGGCLVTMFGRREYSLK